MSERIAKARTFWRSVKSTVGFRRLLTYLVFVAIAALFWFILALNDNIQDDFEVRVNITGVPDSVTFINLPPERIHVTVRDKGTDLWQNGVFGRPSMNLNFRDYADNGVFRLNRSEVNAELKHIFGQQATLISTSLDSLRLQYTTLPGKRVPVVPQTDFAAASGKVIYGKTVAEPKNVLVYGLRETLDTINCVYTERVARRNLEETSEVEVTLKSIKGARLDPAAVKVKVTVEPLVRKESNVSIKVVNQPEGLELLLFPANVNVEYYLPMSDFNRGDMIPEVIVDFKDLERGSKRLPLSKGRKIPSIENVNIMADSVEFTLVRN